ncbi:MAG: trypsin-like peptidase domain-containing protein [Nanoarchaeota archaeon]|nr:trypsin-like peptidase domain-containing protein [Nanoarchaeota archaeon]MBU1501922.1 trypsin-like peptidase domain-containing protein [Nanoarchaeota archaeon]MBU2459343.1 trypsin-like peptidase domain-containing protein [Nanoarchaeota archaeon]
MSKRFPKQVIHRHITLKKHHVWMAGGFTSIVLILLITLSIFTYMLSVNQKINYNNLNNKISDLNLETQSNINSISGSLLEIKSDVTNLGSQFGVINEEFSSLKASVGEDFSEIIDVVIPSVITVRTDSAQGTGFIISSEGYIVTNAHVLADDQGNLATGIKAITSDQDIIDAEFIGFDGILDIALLKISGSYDALELDNSDNIQIGERVIAVGNPLGLQFSVSQGIVSAVHRPGINGLKAYIQTDTPLNPGNSGGPLINKKGLVVGINNFKVSSGEALGFALESNYIKDIVNEISQRELNLTLIN